MSMKSKLLTTLLVFVVLAAGLVIYLASHVGQEGLRAGFNPEFLARPDGYEGLAKAYDFRFPSPPVQLQAGRMYEACANGDVDVISAFATDGRIKAYDLKVLEDDQHFFPPYDAVPLARQAVLKSHPKLRDILDTLAGTIDTATMRSLNLEVDRKNAPRPPAEAARDFLVSADLLGERIAPDSKTKPLRVGSKNFTEQRILGEILKLLLEHHSNYEVNLVGNLASDRTFAALKNDELDLYVEYTGTGLMNYLRHEPLSDAGEVYDLVSRQFKDKWNLLWLEPLGFDNSYTLTMRKAHAEQIGIETLSDLAEHLRNEQTD